MVVVDDESVAERLRHRVPEPVLQRSVEADEQRPQPRPRHRLCLREGQQGLPRTGHAGNRGLRLLRQDVENALLLVGEALQALFLVLDPAPQDGDEPVLGIERFANGFQFVRVGRPVVPAGEAPEDAAHGVRHGPQPGRVQDQLLADVRGQLAGQAAVGERHRESVGEGQAARGPAVTALHDLDDVVHAALHLRERVLVEFAPLRPDLPYPLLAVEDQGTAFHLDKQQAVLRFEEHEVALSLQQRAVRAPREPVETVEDLHAAGQLIEQRPRDRALAGIADVVRLYLRKQPGHQPPRSRRRRPGTRPHVKTAGRHAT